MMLHSGARSSVPKVIWKITEYLLLRAKKWDTIQKFKLQEDSQLSLHKKRKTKRYVNKF